MTLRFATPDEISRWDELIAANPRPNPLQSSCFAEVKSHGGWQPRFCIYEANIPLAALFLERRIPLVGKLWYAPKGPSAATAGQFAAIVAANAQFAATHTNIFAYKLETELPTNAPLPHGLTPIKPVQANAATVVIDLTPDEPAILAGFRQRARRSIRKAEAAGVAIAPVPCDEPHMRTMYELYAATAARAGFYLRDFGYYQRFWRTYSQAGQGQLFIAYHNQQAIAGVFTIYLGTESLYKDGASVVAARNTGASYLLQWEVMRWLKSQGVSHYDMHGTPPPSQLDNPAHPLHELGLFKTAFNATVTQYIGAFDQIIKPVQYKHWVSLGEPLLRRLEPRLHRRTLY